MVVRARRRFLGGFLGALLAWPSRVAANPGKAAPVGVPSRAVLDALADTIVPRDGDPGALDAAVPARILKNLESDPAGRLLYREGAALLDAIARQAHGGPFQSLDAQTREQVLSVLGREPSEVARQFFRRVRQDVLRFYWASEQGQKTVGYRPLAGGYPEYADPPVPPRTRSR